MDDRKLKEHICKELMDMADEWEIEMERWAEKHPEEDRELCRMGNPDFIAAGVADRENMRVFSPPSPLPASPPVPLLAVLLPEQPARRARIITAANSMDKIFFTFSTLPFLVLF